MSDFDRYCWICHTEGINLTCDTCRRSYHNECIEGISSSFLEKDYCPECQANSWGATQATSNRFYKYPYMKKLLNKLIVRSFAKKELRSSILLRWPERKREKLHEIIDYEILVDKINLGRGYSGTSEFYSDVNTLLHNSCVVYGINSAEAKAAEGFKKDFQQELVDLEACPECYYYLHCDDSCEDPFVRLCESPHDIIWAKLAGHPYWPAKCLRITNGVAHVKFFGEHEKSKISLSKCFYLSKNHPQDISSEINDATNVGPKSRSYNYANAELLKYINLYQERHGAFPFYPHKTPYKRQNEAIIVSTGESSNGSMVQNHMEEENVEENPEMSSNYSEDEESVDATSLTFEPFEDQSVTSAISDNEASKTQTEELEEENKGQIYDEYLDELRSENKKMRVNIDFGKTQRQFLGHRTAMFARNTRISTAERFESTISTLQSGNTMLILELEKKEKEFENLKNMHKCQQEKLNNEPKQDSSDS